MKFLTYLKNNWATTALGAATLAGVGVAGYANPALLGSPQAIQGIITGFGLLLAQDPASIQRMQQAQQAQPPAAPPAKPGA